MALCLLLFVNFQLICQENSIVLGGKNGWTDFIQNSKNLTFLHNNKTKGVSEKMRLFLLKISKKKSL